jgi:hypothetical protein
MGKGYISKEFVSPWECILVWVDIEHAITVTFYAHFKAAVRTFVGSAFDWTLHILTKFCWEKILVNPSVAANTPRMLDRD